VAGVLWPTRNPGIAIFWFRCSATTAGRSKMSQRTNVSRASPLWPTMDLFIRNECERIEREKITPWAFFGSGTQMRVTDFYGRQIAYQGLAWGGSARLVFWTRYFEPFWEDVTDRSIKEVFKLCEERKVDARAPLRETEGLLISYDRKLFDRMAQIDQRLAGRGFPNKVPLRRTDREKQQLEQFINAHISAALSSMPPPAGRWKRANKWMKDHPLAGQLLTAIKAAAAHFGI